jgi:urea transport system ATP-binding protein
MTIAIAYDDFAGMDAAPRPRTESRNALLALDGVSVSFDGFKALNNLSFAIEPGTVRSVIGPNGAGKTTMMDVITGKTRPDAGAVLFDGGHDLTRLDEAAIANLGIGRKFQKPTVFENLTILENLELAQKCPRGILRTLTARTSRAQRAQIDDALEIIGFTDRDQTIAGALSHGEKQWLEIGMLCMQDSRLLLLDEPVAGMTDRETEATATLIRRLAGIRTLLVVEHDMEFVRSLDADITVLHEGAVLAEGTMDELQQHAAVVDVYLGR